MITVGTIIGERYEILEKIGTGGMSDVYKAKDSKLNRYVAVKVLKSEFSENTNFVSKFRVEAQAAARLTHPNIVNVYDVGEEGDTHYIVMELVEGITLKNYIEKKARLSVKEAISIAIQVSMGIEAAHNNHIIHRDIKPQNIMISKEGKVKIADFGIAKAATSNTITSNVMGSVHYTSPEQARGGFSDERSDIYSLGCTMYEMLTGRVPFDGETTVAIAIKHIQDDMPSPRDFVSEIPVCVEQIIFKCTQKSPDRRYQSMSELIVDLKKSLISPEENFVKIIDADTGGATKAITEEDLEKIKRQTGNIYLGKVLEDDSASRDDDMYPEEEPAYEEDGDDEDYETDRRRVYAAEEIDAEEEELEEEPEDELEEPEEEEVEEELEEEEEYEDEDEEEQLRRRREAQRRRRQAEQQKRAAEQQRRLDEQKRRQELARRREAGQRKKQQQVQKKRKKSVDEFDAADERMEKITTVLAIVAAVIIGILALVIVGHMMGIFGKKNTGSEIETVKIDNEDTTMQDDTASQEDDQSIKLPEGSVTMINVVGMELDKAKQELAAIELGTKVTEEPSELYEAGVVTAQDIPEGANINKNSTINLVVSSGLNKEEEEEDKVEVVDVKGKSESDAKKALTDAGFTVDVSTEYSDTVEKGNVISQTPAGGEKAEKGSAVKLVVSNGKKEEMVKVPDLRGMTETAAKDKLNSLGLKTGTVSEAYSDTVTAGCVISQTSNPDSEVAKGSSVGFQLSAGPEKKSYKFVTTLNAPTGYTGGNVTVTITGSDGSVRSFTTASFPCAVNETGFTTDSGTVTYTYSAQTAETVIDPETGEQHEEQGEQTVTSNPVAVTFTPE